MLASLPQAEEPPNSKATEKLINTSNPDLVGLDTCITRRSPPPPNAKILDHLEFGSNRIVEHLYP